MLAKRIIACLDCDLGVPGGRVVKGTQFRGLKYAGLPWELAARYSEEGADELVLLDITASIEKRETMACVVERVAEEVRIPLTVGGGITSPEDFARLLSAGADKCAVNTAALQDPRLITAASSRFGSQCVVVAIDAKWNDKLGFYECFAYGGRKTTGRDAVSWAQEAEQLGAGEILLTSIDADGGKNGFDLKLSSLVSDAVSIPVIASGGGGSPADFCEVFTKTLASAALAASIFHFNQVSIRRVKLALAKNGIPVRL